ncbi:hypothetical protein AAY473_007140 [Plecturocebus cupreus]
MARKPIYPTHGADDERSCAFPSRVTQAEVRPHRPTKGSMRESEGVTPLCHIVEGDLTSIIVQENPHPLERGPQGEGSHWGAQDTSEVLSKYSLKELNTDQSQSAPRTADPLYVESSSSSRGCFVTEGGSVTVGQICLRSEYFRSVKFSQALPRYVSAKSMLLDAPKWQTRAQSPGGLTPDCPLRNVSLAALPVSAAPFLRPELALVPTSSRNSVNYNNDKHQLKGNVPKYGERHVHTERHCGGQYPIPLPCKDVHGKDCQLSTQYPFYHLPPLMAHSCSVPHSDIWSLALSSRLECSSAISPHCNLATQVQAILLPQSPQ